jgi:hypothetical protein
LEVLNSRTRGLGFDGVAMARPPNQNPKEKKAYLGVAKAMPKASSSLLETSLAKRLAYKHKYRAEKCFLHTRPFKTLEVNPRCKPN